MHLLGDSPVAHLSFDRLQQGKGHAATFALAIVPAVDQRRMIALTVIRAAAADIGGFPIRPI